MKSTFVVILSRLLLVTLCGFPARAQAQEQKGKLYFFEDLLVKPAMVSQYEAALKKEIELGYPFPFMTYTTADFHYYFIFSIDSYAGIDKVNKGEEEWAAKIGQEKFAVIMKSAEGTFEYYKTGVIRSMPELSYVPKQPRLKPGEQKFISWGFASVEFGKEKELEEVFKQWVALSKENNSGNGFNTFKAEMGVEMPYYFWTETGKSAADYYTEGERESKQMGEQKVADLWGKTIALFKKFETKTGMPRPDLSVMPKK